MAVTKLPLAGARSSRLPSTFRALRHHNFRLWFIGQGISLVGTWMQFMAQQVLVYRLTGSAAALGIVNFMGLIPLIPFSLWGGSITDRFPRRTVIIITQVGMLLQAVILALLTWMGNVQVWHVYLLSLVLGALNAVDVPARQAFTADMVNDKDDLANAIGLNSAMFNGARALGPALAGIVVAATGEAWAFTLNALSFPSVIVCLLLMHDLPIPAQNSGNKPRVLAHLAEGMQYARDNRIILVLFSLIGVSAFLSMPYSTLMPAFADTILKESAAPIVNLVCDGAQPLMRCQSPDALPLGILLTMVGIGALTGALIVASLPGTARYGRWLTVGNLSFPLLLLFFSGTNSFLFASFLMLLIGVSFVWQNALANTMLQLHTPDELRGRVMSLYSLTFQGMMRMGGLQAGFLGDWLGVRLAVGLGAAVSLIYGLFVALRVPELRSRR